MAGFTAVCRACYQAAPTNDEWKPPVLFVGSRLTGKQTPKTGKPPVIRYDCMGNEHEGPADEVGIANAELERRAALLLFPEDTPETLATLVRAPLVAADPAAVMDAEADADVDADAVGAGTDAVGAGTDADVEDSVGVVAIKAEAVDEDDKSEVTNPLLSIVWSVVPRCQPLYLYYICLLARDVYH